MSDNGTFVNSPNRMNIVNMMYNSSTSSVSVASTNVTIISTTVAANGAWFDYTAYSSLVNARAGTVMAITINGVVQFIDTATADIGDTSALTLSVVLSGTALVLQATAASGTWYVTSAVRSSQF